MIMPNTSHRCNGALTTLLCSKTFLAVLEFLEFQDDLGAVDMFSEPGSGMWPSITAMPTVHLTALRMPPATMLLHYMMLNQDFTESDPFVGV